jgi:hypothetical protein
MLAESFGVPTDEVTAAVEALTDQRPAGMERARAGWPRQLTSRRR